MCGGGSGGGTTYSDVTQTTSNLPEYARPYFEDLLSRTGYETAQPYVPYEGQRTAYFSPMEQEAMARAGELGVSGQNPYLSEAANMVGAIGYPGTEISGSSGSRYNPSNFTGSYSAGSRQSGYNPTTQESGYTANQTDPDWDYTPGYREVGFEPGTLADSEMIQHYMDPYYQNVVDLEKREANRQASMRNNETGLTSAGAGSLGGYREAIMRAENERNLGIQTGDIQNRGSKDAFSQAQAAFEADRQANAQLEGFEQSQFEMNQQFRSLFRDLQLRGFSANEAARQAQEQLSQGRYSLNQQALQAGEGFEQSQFGMNEGNKQFKSQLALDAYTASEQAKQKAAELGLSAEQITQAGQIASRNAELMQEQNFLQGSDLMGRYAMQDQDMEIDRLNAMAGAGGSERNMMQSSLDTGYQDFLRQQAWGREQLAFYNSMLQGLDIQPGKTVASYGPQASSTQQMLGSGIAGLGLYNALRGGGG
jgi:hypothetical protein